MTKAELLSLLEPFTDDIEVGICLTNLERALPIVDVRYVTSVAGDGVVVVRPDLDPQAATMLRPDSWARLGEAA